MKVTPQLASLAALLVAHMTLAIPTSAALTPTPSIPALPHTAQEVIAKLNLTANPEKGYFVESFRDPDNATIVTDDGGGATSQQRSFSTAIYYLLEGCEGDSVWHRVDAVEVWHYYAGAPLTLSLSYDDGKPVTKKVLGPDIFAADGQRPQVPIGKLQWQSARSHGDWTLVGTTGECHPFLVLGLDPRFFFRSY